MNYLLDTCVISELVKPRPHRGVVSWISGIEETRFYLSVITLGEIQKGISKLADAGRRERLQAWLDQDLRWRFAGRILNVGEEAALQWGVLHGVAEREGRTPSVADGLIAAIAIQHNLTVVTHNISDFQSFPVRTFDPWTIV